MTFLLAHLILPFFWLAPAPGVQHVVRFDRPQTICYMGHYGLPSGCRTIFVVGPGS